MKAFIGALTPQESNVGRGIKDETAMNDKTIPVNATKELEHGNNSGQSSNSSSFPNIQL